MKNLPVTIPFFDEKESQNVKKVLDSGWVAQGPVVAEFEEAIASHEGIKYGVATTSCTTALHLAMAAEGMGAGMDALAPAFTFVATTNAIVQTGATPVLVDICRDTYNIDVEKLAEVIRNDYREQNGKMVHKETGNILWGIVPVHEFGLCCDISAVNRLAEEYHLKVIEDAACALGAKIGEVHQGGFGNPSCVSFHPRKSITTGEGGMVLTENEALAKRMRELRTHGSTVSADARHHGQGYLLPEFPEAGYNYRMTNLQAALGVAQMEELPEFIRRKNMNYDRYCSCLQTFERGELMRFREGTYANKWFYSLHLYERHPDRSKIICGFDEAGIQTRAIWGLIHMQKPYLRCITYQIEKAEYYSEHIINLPCSTNLQERQIVEICDYIKKNL